MEESKKLEARARVQGAIGEKTRGRASEVRPRAMTRVLIGVSGSVAAIKFDELARERWSASGECEVRFVFTDNALKLIDAEAIARGVENNIKTFTDHDE